MNILLFTGQDTTANQLSFALLEILLNGRIENRYSSSHIVVLRMDFTSDGVGVISGFISATEWESEESERFLFLQTPLRTPSLTFRLLSNESRKQKRRDKPITKHVSSLCD